LAVNAIAVGMKSDSEIPMAPRRARMSVPERAQPVARVTRLQTTRLPTARRRFEIRSPRTPASGQPRA
jgi:hypothetical protein